jgi:hypothetical protein
VLGQDAVEHAVEARDAAADVRAVELERQDGIVPGDL